MEDRVLLGYDLWGSLVHAKMLGATGIIPRGSAQRLRRALIDVARDSARGKVRLDPRLEDVHMNVEALLLRRLGEDGERLQTGRSRNDQVATDLALYTRDALLALERSTGRLVSTLLDRARSTQGREVVSGWTHFQPAQQVYWAQILGTHAARFARDRARLRAARETVEHSPLGSGALAGSSLPLDRRSTSRWLGFRTPNPSSIDAVGDRDFVLETLYGLARVAVHASGLAEELVIGSMPEIRRVTLADSFVTTSSLMPHKRNPDLAELTRAEAAPALGRLVAHLALLKGVPVGYQRDLQAGKPLLFEGVDRGLALLEMLTRMVATTRFHGLSGHPAAMTYSVELTEALVRRGVPFRSAHARVAKYVKTLGTSGRPGKLDSRVNITLDFPELGPKGFRTPSAEDEPELRTTLGGSAWREVDRFLLGLERLNQIATGAERVEARRLLALRREAGLPGALFPLMYAA